MNKKKFAEAINMVDDKYYEEAANYQRKRKTLVWLKWSAIAACMLLIIGTVFTLPSKHDGRTIISNYKTNQGGSYAVPNSGEIGFESAIREARKEYAGKDVVYLLAFDIFDKEREISDEERNKEYQRLISEGYELYTAEYWTYKNNSEKNYHTIVVGYFTESQLELFKPNFQYGYFFFFVTNGDGSSIHVDEYNIITDFPTNYS